MVFGDVYGEKASLARERVRSLVMERHGLNIVSSRWGCPPINDDLIEIIGQSLAGNIEEIKRIYDRLRENESGGPELVLSTHKLTLLPPAPRGLLDGDDPLQLISDEEVAVVVWHPTEWSIRKKIIEMENWDVNELDNPDRSCFVAFVSTNAVDELLEEEGEFRRVTEEEMVKDVDMEFSDFPPSRLYSQGPILLSTHGPSSMFSRAHGLSSVEMPIYHDSPYFDLRLIQIVVRSCLVSWSGDGGDPRAYETCVFRKASDRNEVFWEETTP